jgi:hypothetical protein
LPSLAGAIALVGALVALVCAPSAARAQTSGGDPGDPLDRTTPSDPSAPAPRNVPADPGDPSGGDDDDDDPEETGTVRPRASDKLTNHLLLHGKVGVAFPAGSIASDVATSDVSGAGLTVGGGIGLGLSRYLALEATATYAMLAPQEGCVGSSEAANTLPGFSCKASSFDIGLGFAYHLAQGIAFDPWISFGAGFRMISISGASISPTRTLIDESFRGIDVARFTLGGDFFPLPWAGIGPYLDLALGTTIDRPADLNASLYTFFHMGVRVTFDPVGRRSGAPAAPAEVGGAGGLGSALERRLSWKGF